MRAMRDNKVRQSLDEDHLRILLNETTNALRIQADNLLTQKGIPEQDNERFMVEEASLGAYGSPDYVLRNLIAHLTNHSAREIAAVCGMVDHFKLPKDQLLTDAHVTVCQQLFESNDDMRLFGDASARATSSGEFKKIMEYAMRNIDDGKLIVTLYDEREMHTLHELLDFLPTFKASGHSSLTEGVL